VYHSSLLDLVPERGDHAPRVARPIVLAVHPIIHQRLAEVILVSAEDRAAEDDAIVGAYPPVTVKGSRKVQDPFEQVLPDAHSARGAAKPGGGIGHCDKAARNSEVGILP